MATTTHAEAREAAIAAVAAENETIAALRGQKGEKPHAARLSAGARKANRVREIHEAELELTLAGEPFEPWQDAASPSRLEPMTQAEIEQKIAALAAVISAASTPESVKHTADKRITALRKAAQRRGYKL